MRDTRDQIAKAYETFGLPHGAAFAEIVRTYRQLAARMHPDRFASQPEKKRSEEKLKKLNNAKDILYSHFAGRNKTHVPGSGCACQPIVSDESNIGSRAAAKKNTAAEAGGSAGAGARAATRAPGARAAEETARAAKNDTASTSASNEAAQRNTSLSTKWKLPALPPAANLFHRHLRLIACAGAVLLLIGGLISVASRELSHTIHTTHAEIPRPKTMTTETAGTMDEAAFLKAEQQRAAYDDQHRYDTQIAALMSRIDRDQKLIAAMQQELQRQPGTIAPNYDNVLQAGARWRAQKAIERTVQETALDWKSASDLLDAMRRTHPEIPSQRFAAKPAPTQPFSVQRPG